MFCDRPSYHRGFHWVRAAAAPHRDPGWMLQLGLLGADTASVALPLLGPPPAPLLHKVGQWWQKVLLWHLHRRKVVQHATGTGSWKGVAVKSRIFPAELTRSVLLSGRSRFLLPQTAHGCPRVKS